MLALRDRNGQGTKFMCKMFRITGVLCKPIKFENKIKKIPLTVFLIDANDIPVIMTNEIRFVL